MRVRLLIAASLIVGLGVWVAAQTPPLQNPAQDPATAGALQQGEASLKARRFEEALGVFKRANDLQKKQSAAAFFGISRAYRGLGAYKSEADACADGLKVVGEDKRLAALLHNQRGMALASQAEKNTDKVIKEAEGEFRSVLVLTETMPIAWYNLGAMLLRQSRDDEGRVALQAYLESGARGSEVELAKKMIENPRRGREPFAPEYSFTSLDGDAIRSSELLGKVVLLDFWGTWCGPCREATDDLVRLYKKYSKNPQFVMVGISSDGVNDKGKLVDYINQKGMGWVHVHDMPQRALHRAFDVVKFPTYIVVDPEGVMIEVYQRGVAQTRLEGWGSTMAGQIENGVKRALKKLSASSPDSFVLLAAPGSSSR